MRVSGAVRAAAREQQTPFPPDGSTWLEDDDPELGGGFLPFASSLQPQQQTCSIPRWCRGHQVPLSDTEQKTEEMAQPVHLHGLLRPCKARALPASPRRDPHLLIEGKNRHNQRALIVSH